MTEPNPIEKICCHFAKQLSDAPRSSRLARLAKTAKHIPELLLIDLKMLIVKLDDVQLVGDDIALSLIDVGYCDVKYSEATAFASALRRRLQNYVDDPRVADNARGDFHDRVKWWRMALGRAAELCRWPAIALTGIVPAGHKER